MHIDSKIYDSIIISSCLFGSVYIFSNSLKIINESFLESKNVGMLNAMNYLTAGISGSIFIYGVLKFNHLTK
jgi:hypothetical protein